MHAATVKLGCIYELELIIDAVRPKTSDSQQEPNYNSHVQLGQIGHFDIFAPRKDEITVAG